MDDIIHTIDLQSEEWKQNHDTLIQLIKDGLQKVSKETIKWEDILVEDDPILPILNIKLQNKEVLNKLFNLENVRYLEPLDYWPAGNNYRIASSSGCSGSTVALNTAEYSSIAPGCLLPRNLNNINIPNAWNLAQGLGQRIGVIDAGISFSQEL